MELIIKICLSAWIFLLSAIAAEKVGLVFPDWFNRVLGVVAVFSLVIAIFLLEYLVWFR